MRLQALQKVLGKGLDELLGPIAEAHDVHIWIRETGHSRGLGRVVLVEPDGDVPVVQVAEWAHSAADSLPSTFSNRRRMVSVASWGIMVFGLLGILAESARVRGYPGQARGYMRAGRWGVGVVEFGAGGFFCDGI
jgi:hypothetical protein